MINTRRCTYVRGRVAAAGASGYVRDGGGQSSASCFDTIDRTRKAAEGDVAVVTLPAFVFSDVQSVQHVDTVSCVRRIVLHHRNLE